MLLCVGVPGALFAQLRVQVESPDPLPVRGHHRRVLADTAALEGYLQGLRSDLTRRGFLEASVDSLLPGAAHTWRAVLHRGPRYRWGYLESEGVAEGALRQAGYRPGQWNGRWVSADALQHLQKTLVLQAGDQGYPFAEAGLDSVVWQAGRLSAQLYLRTGPRIYLDTFVLEGGLQLRTAYLKRYLGLFPGAPYPQSAVLRIRERLRALPYVQLDRDPELRFSGDKATLVLPLSPQKASRFDFLLGILPNTIATGRLFVAASLMGDFVNTLGAGERLYLRFEQLRPQTQRIEVETAYPALFGLPIGVELRGNLYKRDTSFLDADFAMGLQYMLFGRNALKLYWAQRSSRLLGFNAEELSRLGRLPANLDVQGSTFGVKLFFEHLDNPFNPRRGWTVQADIGVGRRQIVRNTRIAGLGLDTLYDSLPSAAPQYRLEAEGGLFLPLFKHSTLLGRVQLRSLLSPQPILRNEQFRLGGNRFLRGFDEELFQSTHAVMGTLEYRFLIGDKSWLYSFMDAAWLDNSFAEEVAVRYPLGVGAGITFETRAGILNMSLGYGFLCGQPADAYSPKVHIGLISLF